MAILDEELIRDANEDAEAIRHIRAQMPSSMSALCTDADLQQIIDATVSIYTISGTFKGRKCCPSFGCTAIVYFLRGLSLHFGSRQNPSRFQR